MTMTTATRTQPATELDLFVTVPPRSPEGHVCTVGIIWRTNPDQSARLELRLTHHDGTRTEEPWDVPAETTAHQLMDRLHRLLTTTELARG